MKTTRDFNSVNTGILSKELGNRLHGSHTLAHFVGLLGLLDAPGDGRQLLKRRQLALQLQVARHQRLEA